MRQYMDDIRSVPRLTPEEERELAIRCKQGDAEAIRQMVSANLRLVVSVAREYAGRGVPLLDLIQEGSIGLLAAAGKFDPALEFRFSTYATKWIRHGVTRCLQEHGALIRVPDYTAEQIRRITVAKAELVKTLGQEPTLDQLQARCGISKEKIHKLQQLAPEVCSLDAPAGEDDTIRTLLEDLQAPQPQEELVRQELHRTMERLLSMLDERQRQILRLHFGIENDTCYSLAEIGAMLGISKERARQIEQQAMEKLKKLGADMGLEDFLDD
jgi:RNA polymerase primary sigma factor